VRVRNELQNGIEHSESGAQNGNKNDFALQLKTGCGRERRADGNFFDGEIARGFVKHERGDFTEQPAKFLRLGLRVAQAREIVLHERMRDDRDALHFIILI
jgi:hypothetical protein